MTDVSHVYSDLMGAARFQRAIHTTSDRPEHFLDLVVCRGVLATFVYDSHFFSVTGAAANQTFNRTIGLRGNAPSQGLVLPVDRVRRKLFGQIHVALLCFCGDQQA